jgi:hypothetical protein
MPLLQRKLLLRLMPLLQIMLLMLQVMPLLRVMHL